MIVINFFLASLSDRISIITYKIFNGYEYPFVMDYKIHKEPLAYSMVLGISINRSIEQYKFCKKYSISFVLSVNY